MRLSESQAKDLILAPRNREHIEKVRHTESALRVFTEELDSHELDREYYWRELNTKIKTRSDKKFGRVSQFYRFPLPVVQITDSILNDFYKVFEGKNRFFALTSESDIDALRTWSVLEKPEVWIEKNSRDVFKNKPGSFVVVDRFDDGTPYLIRIDTDRLIDAEIVNEQGQAGYIIFIHSIIKNIDTGTEVKNYAVYDDESYRVYTQGAGGTLTLVSENFHNLGYTPARCFVTTPSNSKNRFKRKVAFSPSLAKLEDWTIFDVFRNYTDHYAPFPITEAPEGKCTNKKCQGGKIIDEEIVDQSTGKKSYKYHTCPTCKGKNNLNLIGPGTHIGIKLQKNKDMEDGSGKFKMHFPETEKMKYVPEKLQTLEIDIRYKTTGIPSLLEKEAVNQLQARGSFASMENVLIRTKTELDILYKWILRTVGNLLFPNARIEIEANFGTEWYLISEEQLQERFDRAKEIGLPKSEQLMIYDQLIETKYKGNSSKIQRAKILIQLDPLPLYSEEEATELFSDGVISREELNLKINFNRFVNRFESEQTSVNEFGSNLEMRDRLSRIREILTVYNNEDLQSKQLPTS